MTRRAKSGRGADLDEIERVYRRRLPELRRVAAAVSGRREAAADLVQEAFVSAVRQRDAFRGEGPVEAWLWRIVVNTARNHRRDARLQVEFNDEAAGRENGHHSEMESQVAAAFARLTERQRLVLFLRYYADLDYRAIAAALEISPGTVGSTLHSGRDSLRELLIEEEAHR